MSYRTSDRKKSSSRRSLDRDSPRSEADWNSGSDRSLDDSRIVNKDRTERDFKSDPRKTIFIGRLSPTTTQDHLRKVFEKYGEIRSLYLIRDIITGDSRRYAFCEYRSSKDADTAYADGHNALIDGRHILVDREMGRTQKGWKSGGNTGGGNRSFSPPPGGSFKNHRFTGLSRFNGRLQFGSSGSRDGGDDRPFNRPRESNFNSGNSRPYGNHPYNRDNRSSFNGSSNYHDNGGRRDTGSSTGGKYQLRMGGPPAGGRYRDFDSSLRSRMHGSNSGGFTGGFRGNHDSDHGGGGGYRNQHSSAGPMRNSRR